MMKKYQMYFTGYAPDFLGDIRKEICFQAACIFNIDFYFMERKGIQILELQPMQKCARDFKR